MKYGKRRKRAMGLLPPLPKMEPRVKPTHVTYKVEPRDFTNLRFRPFLMIEAYMHPESSVRTELKGWQKINGSQHVTEHPSVVDRVSKRTWVRAEVIIDIINDCLIKNQLHGGQTGLDRATYGTEILAHYKKKYADIINRSKANWAAQHALELALEKKYGKEQFDETDWMVI